jgi:Spy/CpxP family protein refolding chaperone
MKIRLIIGGLFSLAIAAALTVPALPVKASSRAALPQADQKKMMHDKLQEVVNDLNLSDDQKSKMKDIFSDAKSKREAIMNDTSLTDDQKRAKMKELHTGTMSKVNEVLTPEQRTQLKEKLEAAKPKAPASNY